MSSRTPLEVLVVDDDARVRDGIRRILADQGHRVQEAEDGESALTRAAEHRFDALLLDVKMPGMSGLVALTRLPEADPALAVIVVSGEDTITSAREAVIKLGAFDVIAKPPDPEHLVAVVGEAARITRSRREPSRARPGGPGDDLGLLGRSPAMQRLLEVVNRAGPTQSTVLVSGENGSGKELVAEAIHKRSRRAGGPLVKLNCAALPRDLVESELFGFEKGAFTGAQQSKKGRIELANGGTLFLDEIGDLSADSQAKLLRALESREVDPLGSTRSVPVDIRLVSATNRDLAAAVESGEFRQDLYFRLNVIPLRVPPLRERPGDVALLAGHFLAQFAGREGTTPKRLSAEALELLEGYGWPGNVRELRNLMERAAVLVPGEEVSAGDLTPWLESAPEIPDAAGLRGQVEQREAEAIRKALEAADWNVTQAAASLGIDRTNLHRKMRKYGIQRR
jgi:DNA-binding NtrC family response regulator